MARKMLLHVDFKLLSLVFLVGIASFVAAASILKFSVKYVDSNLPSSNQGYIYEAMGTLQLALEEAGSVNAALPKFLSEFQGNHDFELWEISSGCDILILPNETSYIKLKEVTSDTEVNLFSTSLFLSTTPSFTTNTDYTISTTTSEPFTTDITTSYPYTTTSYPYITTSYPYPTTSYPYTTPSYPETTTTPTTAGTRTPYSTTTPSAPIPFSIKVISSNAPNNEYIYNAVGGLQFYLGQENNIYSALPLFLKAYQSQEPSYIWKVSTKCDTLILPNDGCYIKLLEEHTNTEINLFT